VEHGALARRVYEFGDVDFVQAGDLYRKVITGKAVVRAESRNVSARTLVAAGQPQIALAKSWIQDRRWSTSLSND
jgi:hypothetical protein